MLKVLRKHRQSLFVKAPLALIVVVFVFWGIGTVIADRVQVVARVNGNAISDVEYKRAVENLQLMYRNMGSNALPPELIQRQALDDLIDQHLLTEEAHRLGLMVTDDELRESIAVIPAFQVDGRFNREAYLERLRANRLQASDFEDLQRTQLLRTKVQELIIAGAHVTEAEVKERFRYDNERVDLRFIKLASADFTAGVQVSDADLESYYAAHKEEFREPERVRIEYLFFDPKNFAAQITPTDDEIAAYYDANEEEFRKPEEVHARHILFRAAAGATPEQRADVRKQATTVLQQLETGADFAELAKQHSQDSSAPSGGDVGWFSRGQMVPSFEAAAFALPPGGISEVVESPFGFHIVKTEEKRPERVESLDEARGAIVETIRTQRSRELALQQAEKAHERVLDQAPMGDVAKELGVSLQTPVPFSRAEPIVGLTNGADLVQTAFEADTGEVGEIIGTESGYIVFRLTERIDSTVPELAAVREKVEAAVRRERAAAAAKERAESLLKRLQESKDLDALASAEQIEVQDSGPFGRAGGAIPGIGNVPALKEAAFTLTPAAPVAPTAYVADGDAVVAVLKERIPADESQFAQQQKSLTDQSRRRLAGALQEQFINYLKGQAQIEIDPNYMAVAGSESPDRS